MATHLQMQYPEPDSTTLRWVTIFVLISLLAHVLFISGLLLVAHYVPAPKFATPPPPTTPKVTLTLIPPPPAPPQPRPFMVTPPQPNTPPPKDAQVESNNDTRLTSQSQQSRSNNSVMPDVVSQHQHADSLHNSPNIPSKPKPGPTSPQKQQAQPKPKTQPQPAPRVETTPPQAIVRPPDKTPPQVQKPAPKQVTSQNGLPVLPPINAPPMDQTPEPQNSGSPNPVMPAVAQDIQGRAGMSGAPTPEAMATDLGRYKAYIYNVVGSYWYPSVDRSFQLLPVGMVRIRYTIHSDGTLSDVTVLEGDNATMQQLMLISLNSLRAPAPFKPFPDALRKKMDSYTDEFTFSVY
ncbi:MAG: hypothetical protein LV479_00180 [Methylacidiphilales bacterium]|nr:hypothetical protein [Candidatus Methylacidiphilales bacterium]